MVSRAAAVGAAASSFNLEFLLLGRVGTHVLFHLALVLLALTLSAEVREQRAEAGAEALLLAGGVGHWDWY
jgi:hypothetical protein